MNQSYWLIIAIVAAMVCNGNCRPRDVDIRDIYPVYRGKQLELNTPNSSEVSTTESAKSRAETEASQPVKEAKPLNHSKDSKINIESIATVARASSDGPLPSQAAIGQLIDTVGQMVDSDIRTPPKLKEIIKEKSNDHRKEALGEVPHFTVTAQYEDVGRIDDGDFVNTEKGLFKDISEGKASGMNTDDGVEGIAIPVVMDDIDTEPTSPPKKLQKIPEVAKPAKDEKKKNGIGKPHPTTTPSSGLSTWILLSDNRDVTTPTPKKSSSKKDSEEKKKINGNGSTTKKPAKTQATTLKVPATTSVNKVTAKPVSSSKKSETESMSALEAMVKNQKKSLTTTSKPKTSEETKLVTLKKPSDSKKKYPDRMEAAETKDRGEITLPPYTIPTSLLVTTEDRNTVAMTELTSAQAATESSVEGTTKKKKSSSKKKKKNKNRRRKPSNETALEPKIPIQPMGSQIYNFLSREIVPTVGLGLIGVALTAGLASFLGYNPFVSTNTVPLRRTYETHHGYSPNNYYSYNTDYGDGGQSEEALLREVLSGMPEGSRYGLTHAESNYPEAYNRQDQMYDNVKNPIYSSGTGSSYNTEKDSNYDANYPQDYSTAYENSYDAPNNQDKRYSNEVRDKYPVYNRGTGTSFVYPEGSGVTDDNTSRLGDEYSTQTSTTAKYTKTSSDTIERQPEALYRVAGETDLQYRKGESTIKGISSQNSWHRIGSPMEPAHHFPHVEPGPRSLDFRKLEGKKQVKPEEKPEVKKRSKREAESVIQRISRKRTKKENDVENEIDFEDEKMLSDQNPFDDVSTTTAATKTTTYYFSETTTTSPDTNEITSSSIVGKDSSAIGTTEQPKMTTTETYQADESPTEILGGGAGSGVSVLDVLKRLAQFKLRLGLNFLRSTTDLFSRYLDDIQRRVDESFPNNTTTVQYNRRNPWTRIFFTRISNSYRKKRSVLDDNQFLGAMLTEEDKTDERFSKSMKKDLRPSDKIFHQKKIAPKKYKSNDSN